MNQTLPSNSEKIINLKIRSWKNPKFDCQINGQALLAAILYSLGGPKVGQTGKHKHKVFLTWNFELVEVTNSLLAAQAGFEKKGYNFCDTDSCDTKLESQCIFLVQECW